MALVQFGGGVAAISGKDGGTVYARNRSGAYMRNWAKPTNAPSPSQTLNRVRFGNMSAGFASLTKTQQTDWEALAASVTRKNRFGADYVPTGRQMYLEINNNLAANDQATKSAPPADVTPPTIPETVGFNVTVETGEIATMELTGTGVDATKIYVVEATPPLGNSKNNATLLFRTIGNFIGSATAIDLSDSYAAVFGNAAEVGQNIQFRVRTLKLENGIYSTYLLSPEIIEAE